MAESSTPALLAYELAEVMAAHNERDKLYYEFLRQPSLSLGLYVLPAGGTDPQQPHTEDEIYYIIKGNAVLRVNETDRPVQPGSILFVAAHEPHHFHSITDELHVLVFFAPAEGSAAAGGASA